MTISKDLTIKDVLEINKELAEVLMEHGMHCVGCPAHSQETIEEACGVHGIDTNELVDAMNEFLNKKN